MIRSLVLFNIAAFVLFAFRLLRWQPPCHWSNPEGYGELEHMNPPEPRLNLSRILVEHYSIGFLLLNPADSIQDDNDGYGIYEKRKKITKNKNISYNKLVQTFHTYRLRLPYISSYSNRGCLKVPGIVTNMKATVPSTDYNNSEPGSTGLCLRQTCKVLNGRKVS